ncbi:MAG: hypothetical protein PWQ67_1507 [Clostridia bacterium]|jgi:uncharacterized alkaline shock family protein YloU|nr:hypothetical protein [Clostridia bacterium]MDN5323053.1 hypothetical protein [Clostridia bacterium]
MQSERIFRILFALLLFTISTLAVGLALGWTTPLTYLDSLLTSVNERWVLGILGLLGILVGITVLRNTFKNRTPTQTEVVVTSLGKIKITINALEHMAGKVAKQVQGVKESKPVIKCTPNGIAIFMQVNLAPEMNIPETTTQIQNKVKEYFSKVAGIDVEEVRILITKLSNEAKSRVE